MEKYNYKSHVFGLVALFTMGNAAVAQPFYNRKNFLTVFICTALFTLIFAMVLVPVVKFALKRKKLRIIITVLTAAVAVYGAASAAVEYIAFLQKNQLPRTSAALIIFSLVVLMGFVLFCKNHTVLKLGLLLAVITGAMLLLIFSVSINMFDLGELEFKINFSKDALITSIRCFLKYFSSLFSAVVFVTVTLDNAQYVSVVGGTAMGLLGLLLCALQSVFVLGGAQYEFPYFYAVSAFSSGSLFTRLDGLVYFVFFATSIVKITVCLKAIKATALTVR